MQFTEAVELATRIRERPTWYVLEIGPESGRPLEDDLWGVMAASNLYHRFVHYWCGDVSVESIVRRLPEVEEDMRRRYSSHEL